METPAEVLAIDARCQNNRRQADGTRGKILAQRLAARAGVDPGGTLLRRAAAAAAATCGDRVAGVARSSQGYGRGADTTQAPALEAVLPAGARVEVILGRSVYTDVAAILDAGTSAREHISCGADEDVLLTFTDPSRVSRFMGGFQQVLAAGFAILLLSMPVAAYRSAVQRAAAAGGGARALVSVLIGTKAADRLLDTECADLAARMATEAARVGAVRAGDPGASQLMPALLLLHPRRGVHEELLDLLESQPASDARALGEGSSFLALMTEEVAAHMWAILDWHTCGCVDPAPMLCCMPPAGGPPLPRRPGPLRLQPGSDELPQCGILTRVSTQRQASNSSFVRQYAFCWAALVAITGSVACARGAHICQLVGSVYCLVANPSIAQLQTASVVPDALVYLQSRGCRVVVAMHQDRYARGGLATLCAYAQQLGLELWVAFGPNRQIMRIA